ncbi:MAG: hydroxymethylpyrimidine/phosphomethylpyrimidine kinase [Bacteroidetes bacterium]|nr:hydroxymethylpyrimidine/phosphomethylpyrimidine kinase [Bacteroidota bacterium]
MQLLKPICLSIGGFDPSGGAGVLADIKTFEQNGVAACAITTCITYQNESEFEGVKWLPFSEIEKQFNVLAEIYKFSFVKIGLLKNLDFLLKIIDLLYMHNKKVSIIWDTVLSASSGFSFHQKINQKKLKQILEKVYLITPNWEEIKLLSGNENALRAAITLASTTNVFLKGGHAKGKTSEDILFFDGKWTLYSTDRLKTKGKHGSGCVLSSAITAQLSLGNSLQQACIVAKEYTLGFLKSNDSLLGTHKGIL